MHVRMVRLQRLWIFLACVFSLFLYCEFLVYYVVLLQCSWPSIDDAGHGSTKAEKPLRIMALADTHLLGTREGHWFDKLRREWQMERTFQSAMTIHSPDVVFILGDLLDEGKWSSDAEFYDTVHRFHKMFRHPDKTDLHVVVGNHDIGFHYMIDEQKRRRFRSSFNAPPVQMLNIRGNIFVLINSMAMEGDTCSMCQEAEEKLQVISDSLKCAQGKIQAEYCTKENLFKYSQPIVMQHFPMYRPSDHNCTGPDIAPPKEINIPFKPKFDCLSKESSDKLFGRLKPRLILTGHTHHFCYRRHPDGTPEWTVPSFSWRNKVNPSFLLGVISPGDHIVKKCYMPNEDTVLWTYIVGGTLAVLWLIFPRRLLARTPRSYSSKLH